MSKYKNTKKNGYHSIREANRAADLHLMQTNGDILDLKEQVKFVLAPSVVINGRKKPELRYFADFTYHYRGGELIVEDVKGVLTEVYRIKRHLMKSVHGIDILET